MRLDKSVYLLLILVFIVGTAHANTEWRILLGEKHRDDEAVAVAIADLQRTGAAVGLSFEVVSGTASQGMGNSIVVGDGLRNPYTAALFSRFKLSDPVFSNPDGYRINTLSEGDSRTLVVAGGSIIGDVYGLYWIWDRIRVNRYIPDINVVREPAMGIRLGGAWGRTAYGGSTKKQMQTALRHSFNWVSGPTILDLVPWGAEPEATENAKNRETARELIAYAHGLHMKYYAFANAFTYHPSLMKEFGATPTPCDPLFWDCVQEEYRRLLQALPELDGISLCNDDVSGFWGRYLPFDVTREAPECDWSYIKRFNTFVSKVHDVVSEEFNKTYFHFTWGLREHEVHCQPEVFRAIFNEDIPTENLYLMPKITRGDRWWHQPYNATFNQTPHNTIVFFETMNYYESGSANIFPTFSGQYFQRGLQSFLVSENTNVRGAAALAGASRDAWGTIGVYSYVLYRLMWNPDESMEQITRDFCAIHFGVDVAEDMAQIYMLSPSAYKYGLHIEPISYGQFNSFLHMRVGVFPAEGYIAIDNGKEHLKFLHRIYLRCDPWRKETMRAIEQGRQCAEQMIELYSSIKTRMADQDLAADIENRIAMTHNLIRTNMGYVNTLFAYFDYMERPTSQTHAALVEAYNNLIAVKTDFMNTPKFSYKFFGIDVLLRNAANAIKDVEAAKIQLESTPDRCELEGIIAAQQQRYKEVLESHKETAVRFAHFEFFVDGQDMLIISGDTYHIENIRWDGAHAEVDDILVPLPREEVTVVIRDIESRPIHPFVLEQPSAENDYTVRIYLDDAP
ncbi:MAG: hypothetical protein KAH38_04260, partial [Candidatus Hydrogenedentes bacterium]|nr:hypothetical protein [Candidatus Hydrogenedentota bacterium]